MRNVVIVESPAKAKTINRYLGKDFLVLASYGHVRDLPSKNGSVLPDEGFQMVWEIDDRANKVIRDIAKAVKESDALYLATDPDREGEAISWHICEVLKEKKALKNQPVCRIVFNEITQRAITEAIKTPREIHRPLVEAYLARRALDYLYGFTLSPVLWRKLPGARSAGRVQSVALRLVVDREKEIEVFQSEEYWSIEVTFQTIRKESFVARLTYLNGEKLSKLSITSEHQAQSAVVAIKERDFLISSIQKKQVRRSPAPPFTTSTLQQEASRKLGFSATQTMRTAQRLYEGIDVGGEPLALITYMRTDSVNLSQDALEQSRAYIQKNYGKDYCPSTARFYKNKVKNAQEAHEAIRPISIDRTPQEVRGFLDDGQFKLYDLIWKRTVASQMEQAVFDQMSVDLLSKDQKVGCRATGSVLVFDGFLKVYQEGTDQEDEEKEGLLPIMNEGEPAEKKGIEPFQHFTQPPPRYTEASLVKKLEELGIGRPSTYASILGILQERNYVRLERKQFIPEERGRLVVGFLTHFFSRYVEYDFTAHLEDELDEISQGELNWQKVLKEFWGSFIQTVQSSKDLKPEQINLALEEELKVHLSKIGDRQCPSCQQGVLGLKISRYGVFLGCDRYPDCSYRRSLIEEDTPKMEKIVIGTDPENNLPISLRQGPYGPYLQWGGEEQQEAGVAKKKGKQPKPKRIGIPAGTDISQVTLDMALKLKSLPWVLGTYPGTEESILLNQGPFGPYVKFQDVFASLPKSVDFWSVTLDQAVEILEKKINGRKKGNEKRKKKT